MQDQRKKKGSDENNEENKHQPIHLNITRMYDNCDLSPNPSERADDLRYERENTNRQDQLNIHQRIRKTRNYP